MVTILKLGGSVITDKSTPETVDRGNLERVVSVLCDAGDSPLVVVHGGGSYGHPSAARHGVTHQSGTTDTAAVVDIHWSMLALNRVVLESFDSVGIAAIPIHPLSCVTRSGDEISLDGTAITTMIDAGFVPVLHGDLVVNRDGAVTVVSGDDLVVCLARILDADRVGLCSDVDGVLANGEVINRITRDDHLGDIFGGSDTTDVTGGMAGKVQRLLELDRPSSIFGLSSLEAFIDGEQPGTTIDPSGRR